MTPLRHALTIIWLVVVCIVLTLLASVAVWDAVAWSIRDKAFALRDIGEVTVYAYLLALAWSQLRENWGRE